ADLSDNFLVGTIPDSFRKFAKPGIQVRLNSNFLSCCAINSSNSTRLYNATYAHEVYGGMDWGAHLLPSWLTFSSFSVPLARDRGLNYTGLRCPALRLAGNVDDISTVLDWTLDPDYYLYTNCECSL
ncbi:uncharacterized protein HaLaN_06355, partial [Haematococcus lacustris]